MSEQQKYESSTQLDPARKAWVESVTILLRHKTLIIISVLIVTILTAVYVFFFAEVWYTASANVVPARKPGGLLDNLSEGITSTIKDLGLTPLAGKSKNDGTYSPLALVSSKRVQEKLVKEFDLMKEYKTPQMEDACKEFALHASVDILEEGNVSISFEDNDPKRAALIANRMVDELNTVNSDLAMEEARFNRTYVERRYNDVVVSLDSAEKAFGEFQRKYGVYELKTQAGAELSVLSSLEQQRYLSEIQFANAQQLYGEQSPEASMIRTQLDQLRAKLEDLKTGMDKEAKDYFVPTNVMPDVALDYLRLTREVEIQSKLKAFLVPTVEQARLDETKHTLLYLTLDPATPPIHKSRPKRSIVIVSAFGGSFVIIIILMLFLTRIRAMREGFKRDRDLLGV